MDSEILGKIRVVCPCFNEAQGIRLFYAELSRVLRAVGDYEFQIVFVDDGSSDGTLLALNEIAAEDATVQVFSLSKNFGHQAALLAGIDTADLDTDALVMMDSDLQHPPNLIPQMIESWEQGAEVVSMVRRQTTDQRAGKRFTSWLYYQMMNRLTDIKLVGGAADFCLLGDAALAAIRAMPERDLFLRGAIAWIGFDRKLVEFDVPGRLHGESKYTPLKMLALARMGIFGFSTSPIRLCWRVGMIVTALATVHLFSGIWAYWTGGTVRGWTSLIAVIVFFGGVNLFTLGVLGEYIARTFEESKQRPRYLFKQDPRRPVRQLARALRPRRVRTQETTL